MTSSSPEFPSRYTPSPEPLSPRKPRPTILFVISVDWFFQSHFLHLARRAKAAGYDVVVLTRLQRTGSRFADAGFDVVDLPSERTGSGARGIKDAIAIVRRELQKRPGAMLHGFGLFGMIVGSLSIGRLRAHPAIYTITGRGFLAADRSIPATFKRAAVRAYVSRIVDHQTVAWIAENTTDADHLGLVLARDAKRLTVVGGAGVDPEQFHVAPLPPVPPVRCLLVARAIWSKGIDVAVDAIGHARRAGASVELTIVGGLDPDNPRGYSDADMRAFADRPGVTWLGHRSDVAVLWSQFHVAILPSRGGEGVPKSLLEAAASGRTIITTDVPGCREFADRIGGVVVPIDDARALDPEDLATRGARARSVVVEGFSEAAVWDQFSAVYHRQRQFS